MKNCDLQEAGCCCLFCIGIILLALVSLTPFVTSVYALELQLSDCAKCHAFVAKMMADDDSQHATAVACKDCHLRHPPAADHTIKGCTSCHTVQPHYQVGNCLHCHRNPHLPMTHLRDPIKPARAECLSCHAEVGTQMTVGPSQHAQLFCNRCHERHKQIPECLNCHSPHLNELTATDCGVCHNAHQPRRVLLDRYLPVPICRSCHIQETREIAVTQSRHGQLNCVYCHHGLHTTIPECGDCHGLPHSMMIHRQHIRCLDCHGSAHQLISGR